MSRPRAADLAIHVSGGVMYKGKLYSDEEWARAERRRATYRRSKAGTRGPSSPHNDDTTASVAALYAMGLYPSEICDRLSISDSTVSRCLGYLKSYWSAPTWRAAAVLEWQAATGEGVAA